MRPNLPKRKWMICKKKVSTQIQVPTQPVELARLLSKKKRNTDIKSLSRKMSDPTKFRVERYQNLSMVVILLASV